MSGKAMLSSNKLIEKIPNIRYDTYFAIFGMLSVQANVSSINPIQTGALRAINGTNNNSPDVSNILKRTKLRSIYCRIVNMMLWLFALRSFILMFISDRQLQLYLGDFSIYWNDYQMYYLFPMFFISIQTSITASLFLGKQSKLEWLVPFFSIRQTLSLQQHSDRYYRISIGDFKIRIYLGILLSMTFVAVATSAVAMTYFETTYFISEIPFTISMAWTIINSIWFFYMAGILAFTVFYFNLVCRVISQRFADIAKDIERLTEQETITAQAKCAALNALYFEHNEVCELVDESNSFWAGHIFNTYAIFIPGACYTLYCLFFSKWDPLLSATLWSLLSLTIIVVGFMSLSAAGVASEAHSPYTPLHTLSLMQLPVESEVNMSTFLHRVRGPMIGFSCMDLFVVTNSAISSTVAAVASYFLIVADFSRSTVSYNAAPKSNNTLDAAKQLVESTVANITGSAFINNTQAL